MRRRKMRHTTPRMGQRDKQIASCRGKARLGIARPSRFVVALAMAGDFAFLATDTGGEDDICAIWQHGWSVF